MGKHSRDKGKRGERELAAVLTAAGFPARRGRQYCGDPSAPDVVADLPFFVEVKRTERLSVYEAIEQAEADSAGRPVLVAHRRNGKPWLAILPLQDFLRLLQ
ncbi:MAG: hypothetical protein JJT85_09505 [Chromatiales bacterium]|nr:hypothetical protein [Chromatiales bacterium]